ncbi:hypothetical protein EW093_09860 [Thiospirochaeta perfilievii]|uniref:Phospholipid/glycerol acyltransferase domain-containing protein n=1 Tax=Thiospirochaeta perfilievii TaxID=252967 RepID=A0A5C1QBU8_9SPIO|nr:lysophospholipid acyltransferase family protein [Thiospirochaeta perfilievii]QEN05001.1 hypothetical protein EW093_09860 [Thiospirochaeta perfilievii]
MIILNLLGTLFYYFTFGMFMILYTPVCFLVWIVTTPFDKLRRINHKMNSLVGFLMMFLNPFWRTKIHGLENVDRNETYVITPNHLSLTDICILASTGLDLKWISKKEISYIPTLGWMMLMGKDILLDRKDPKSQFSMMRKSEYYLNEGVSIAIFPEGTRSVSGELGKFRDGAALLAKKTNRKVLPVCNYGNNHAMPKKGFIWNKKVEMNMYFLPPIFPSEYKTKELSNLIKDSIQKKTDELNSLK